MRHQVVQTLIASPDTEKNQIPMTKYEAFS